MERHPLEENWEGRLVAWPAEMGTLALTGRMWELEQEEVPTPESAVAQLPVAVEVVSVCLGSASRTKALIISFAEQHQLGCVRTCFVLC